MDDLRSQALVLIYPDGIVEKIPVKKGVAFHLYYLRDWFKISKKFANVIYHSNYKIDFKDCGILDNALAEAGLVVIRNLEIFYLADDMSLVDSEAPFAYLVNLPSNIRESKAYAPLKEILRGNQREKYIFGIYSLAIKRFVDIEYNFMEEALENKEEEIKR